MVTSSRLRAAEARRRVRRGWTNPRTPWRLRPRRRTRRPALMRSPDTVTAAFEPLPARDVPRRVAARVPARL